MSIYEIKNASDALKGNSYAGRGIITGCSESGKYAVAAYFIMGRSENSRNRIFEKTEDGIIIKPFDADKVEDPSLIIYSPVRRIDNKLIVTNGDQTDTVYEFAKNGKCFKKALTTRCFEPDAPNFTPRISAMLTFENGGFSYEMSILKSMDSEGTKCARYIYSYPSLAGLGHFIHTYQHDGDPLPSFCGEPERIKIPDDMDEFFEQIWESLDAQNKISLYVEYTDLKSGTVKSRIINKNTK